MNLGKILQSPKQASKEGDVKWLDTKYLSLFSLFWFIVAGLELAQDYLSAELNDNYFSWADSLSYKLFWPLFIPFSIGLAFLMVKLRQRLRMPFFFLFVIFLVLLFTLIHLFLFSVFLFGFSNLTHEAPSTMVSLIYEKLSTRLYLALSIYSAICGLFIFYLSKKTKTQQPKAAAETLRIKTGTKSILIKVDNILYITSDGPYLEIFTAEKKHVLTDSLKNIIKQLPDNFKRIHKSTIVNLDKVKSLKSRGNGDYDVLLSENSELRLSRTYAKPLKGKLL